LTLSSRKLRRYHLNKGFSAKYIEGGINGIIPPVNLGKRNSPFGAISIAHSGLRSMDEQYSRMAEAPRELPARINFFSSGISPFITSVISSLSLDMSKSALLIS